jgi:hypothetical protein
VVFRVQVAFDGPLVEGPEPDEALFVSREAPSIVLPVEGPPDDDSVPASRPFNTQRENEFLIPVFQKISIILLIHVVKKRARKYNTRKSA